VPAGEVLLELGDRHPQRRGVRLAERLDRRQVPLVVHVEAGELAVLGDQGERPDGAVHDCVYPDVHVISLSCGD
jgi:hypothetical protein